MSEETQVAETIIAQLGGFGRLKAMVGAFNFAKAENYVVFRFKGSRKFNMLKVTLDLDDTYTVEFIKYSPSKSTATTVKKCSMIYCDMLVSLFEDTTGLYLNIPDLDRLIEKRHMS